VLAGDLFEAIAEPGEELRREGEAEELAVVSLAGDVAEVVVGLDVGRAQRELAGAAAGIQQAGGLGQDVCREPAVLAELVEDVAATIGVGGSQAAGEVDLRDRELAGGDGDDDLLGLLDVTAGEEALDALEGLTQARAEAEDGGDLGELHLVDPVALVAFRDQGVVDGSEGSVPVDGEELSGGEGLAAELEDAAAGGGDDEGAPAEVAELLVEPAVEGPAVVAGDGGGRTAIGGERVESLGRPGRAGAVDTATGRGRDPGAVERLGDGGGERAWDGDGGHGGFPGDPVYVE
jgi:hypothetical protein